MQKKRSILGTALGLHNLAKAVKAVYRKVNGTHEGKKYGK